MPQDTSRDRKVGPRAQVRATLLRAGVGIALIGLAVGLETSGARAQTYGTNDNGSPWGGLADFFKKFGQTKSATTDPDLKYTERPPLVVPPTRDLPPPAAAGPPPAADWPQDPPVKHHKQAKAKVVVAQPAAAAAGGAAAGAPADANATQRVANPETPKKSLFNPSSWFNKEEYATFTGEPARENLTDPPTGYRTPSPDQPYGIAPEKKDKPKTAADGTQMQTGSQPAAPTSAPPGGAPATPTSAPPSGAPASPAGH
jgi:hypothetical protein